MEVKWGEDWWQATIKRVSYYIIIIYFIAIISIIISIMT